MGQNQTTANSETRVVSVMDTIGGENQFNTTQALFLLSRPATEWNNEEAVTKHGSVVTAVVQQHRVVSNHSSDTP